jgi:hypothetical protein
MNTSRLMKAQISRDVIILGRAFHAISICCVTLSCLPAQSQPCWKPLEAASLRYTRPKLESSMILLSWDNGPYEHCHWHEQGMIYRCGHRLYAAGMSTIYFVDNRPIDHHAYSVIVPFRVIAKSGEHWPFDPLLNGDQNSVSSKNFKCVRSNDDPSLFLQQEQRLLFGIVPQANIRIRIKAVSTISYRVLSPRF